MYNVKNDNKTIFLCLTVNQPINDLFYDSKQLVFARFYLIKLGKLVGIFNTRKMKHKTA